MKMHDKDFIELKKQINSTLDNSDRDKVIDNYETGKFYRSDRVKVLQIRFCWDLFWASNRASLNLDYLLDSHIETALKKIVPTITKRY